MLGSRCLGQYLAPDLNSVALSPVLDGKRPLAPKAFTVSTECSAGQPSGASLLSTWLQYPFGRESPREFSPEHWQ